MGTFLIILIILFVIWPLLRGPVTRWFQGFASRRAEDMMRRMMGMPSRKEERKRQKRQRSSQPDPGQRHSANAPKPHPATLMKSVAVDVEYTEIKEFEQTATIVSDGDTTRIIVEEQISDAEYIEIKSPKNPTN